MVRGRAEVGRVGIGSFAVRLQDQLHEVCGRRKPVLKLAIGIRLIVEKRLGAIHPDFMTIDD